MLCERKRYMVPGRRDRRSTSVAVRRTCGKESALEEGKIGWGRRVQTQNTKKKTIIDTRTRVQTSTSSTTEFEVQPAECSMHAPAHAVVWHSINPALHAVLPRHLLGCLKAFLLGWRTVLLSTSWSGVKWLDNEADKRREHVRRRKKKVTASVRTARTVWKDANFDAPWGGFDSFSSLGLFFFGNNALWTTVWSLSIDVSFNL